MALEVAPFYLKLILVVFGGITVAIISLVVHHILRRMRNRERKRDLNVPQELAEVKCDTPPASQRDQGESLPRGPLSYTEPVAPAVEPDPHQHPSVVSL
jgi:FtsZ-interacting cell division protein ZipA